jgi:ankyrin repeat protein
MHAAYFNRKELVNQLLAAGAKVEEKDKTGRTALILAQNEMTRKLCKR